MKESGRRILCTPWPLRLVTVRYRHVTWLYSIPVRSTTPTLSIGTCSASGQYVDVSSLGYGNCRLCAQSTQVGNTRIFFTFRYLTIQTASDPTVSPALLTRARLLAAEHTKLSDRLGESFDSKIAKRAGELAPIADVLKEWVTANEVGPGNPAHGISTDSI